jgi:hypothetical protein
MPPQPEYVRCERIYNPTKDDIRCAAHILDQIASLENIKYGYVGTFIAFLRDRPCELHDIEIVVDPSAKENYAEKWREAARKYPQYLAITPFDHHIVLVRENKGIAVQCTSLGEPGYPHEFIEPYDSRLRPPEHFNLEPTFYMQSLGYPENDRAVPVFVFRLLILQRLWRFNPNAVDQKEKERNSRDIDDIKAFLWCANDDREEPFPGDLVPTLLPLVRLWIKFAESNFVGTRVDEVLMWIRLGIPLTYQNVSNLFR